MCGVLSDASAPNVIAAVHAPAGAFLPCRGVGISGKKVPLHRRHDAVTPLDGAA